MTYRYTLRVQGREVVLVQTETIIRSLQELYRRSVHDPENFQRLYDHCTPDDVSSVLLRGDLFEFLLCADLSFFRKWLRSELMKGQYRCEISE